MVDRNLGNFIERFIKKKFFRAIILNDQVYKRSPIVSSELEQVSRQNERQA